jgi:hypothetical protein
VLTAAAAQRAAAKVIMNDGVAWLELAAIAADPAGEIYLLWQIAGAHTPLPVGFFGIRAGAHVPLRIGSLPVPHSGTWAFAVSLEHGRIIPVPHQTRVALVQVS